MQTIKPRIVMKYIDAEKLIAEIEKTRREFINKGEQNLHDAEIIRRSVISSCNDFLTLITSLQQEQPEVDLKEEITSFFSKNPIPYEHITDWPLLKNTALHFYELGLNARKED